jgi:hypothetical protein
VNSLPGAEQDVLAGASGRRLATRGSRTAHHIERAELPALFRRDRTVFDAMEVEARCAIEPAIEDA